jgi:glycosyltransferase involved in cell wall biosynthesis
VSDLISVIVPVHNASATLTRCLAAISQSEYRDFECLVVDDGSTDGSAALAESFSVRILKVQGRKGPAHARNLASQAAVGDILLFIDADVCIEPGTLSRIARTFADDATLDALIGSYDDSPDAPNFLSQYKNLMHCFVHQQAKRRASTFWTGCGAIRRSVFAAGGFDERYVRPSIEDIELGARLIRAARKIELDPAMTVKHLKRWTLPGLLASDVRDRAIPWTLLILRERHMPNDLNVQWSQRVSVALTWLALLLAPVAWPASAIAIAVAIGLNHSFYRFLAGRRGALFALRAVPLHLFYFLYSGAAFLTACVLAFVSRSRPRLQRS